MKQKMITFVPSTDLPDIVTDPTNVIPADSDAIGWASNDSMLIPNSGLGTKMIDYTCPFDLWPLHSLEGTWPNSLCLFPLLESC